MPRRIEADAQTARVGARLRELRLERGMSLSDLSDVSSVSKGHLSSIEHGLAAINVQTISRLAKGLGVPPFYLLTAPNDDERDLVVEFVRKLPAVEIVKLRKDLVKAAKAAERAAAKIARV